MKSIHIGNIELYIERDKEGYVSICTDGYPHEAMAPVLAALRSLQTDDDREADDLSAEHDAWARATSGGAR